MKKFLLVCTIAGFAVACNNDSETKEEKKVDSPAVVTPPAVDTTVHVDTTHMDTTKPKM